MNRDSQQLERLIQRVRSTLEDRRTVPRATYRLEFDSKHMTFREAAELVPYLAQLGISHVYSSPYFKVSTEAGHGYAIVDYNQLNPELGSPQDYGTLIAALHEHGMKHILDFVPNHMSAAPGENLWWTDVLKNGQSSRFNDYFDINWDSSGSENPRRLLLPILGQQFGKALEAGELRIVHADRLFQVHLHEKLLPLDPATWVFLLRPVVEEFRSTNPPQEDLLELESILHSLEQLPARDRLEGELRETRLREQQVASHRLSELVSRSPLLADQIDLTLRTLNGVPGIPSSFNAMETLLNQQAYRVSYWRAASDEVNYRRFFDINELVAICPERIDVFEASHRLVLELLVEGKVDGLRIDHVDGLLDPLTYLWRLQWSYVRGLARHVWLNECENDPVEGEHSWKHLEPQFLAMFWKLVGGPSPFKILELPQADSAAEQMPQGVMPFHRASLPLYVVVEKILGQEEPLPENWPVAGTTGYDFLNLVGGLFVHPEGLAKIRRNYPRLTGEEADFRTVVIHSKRLILESSMSSEIHLLASRLKRIVEGFRQYRDFTLNTILTALKDVITAFPVYRTYAGQEGISDRDRQILKRALRQARRFGSLSDSSFFEFLQSLLLFGLRDDRSPQELVEQDFFVGRFQQVTSPVMAKGVEDTAFYRWLPLISVNEVGGDPTSASQSVAAFHQRNVERNQEWPHTLLCTSTHDTKRSEDVRARIHLLSEIPDKWRSTVARWSRLNRRFVGTLPEGPTPSRNDEYHFYQALIGMWVAAEESAEHEKLVERLVRYQLKSARESKLRTSWSTPDLEYEQGLELFVRQTLRRDPKNRFLREVQDFLDQFLRFGLLTSLSQLVLKLTVPGIPDIYQGQELWDFSLVDPDNRRPVDSSLRRQLLQEIQARWEDETTRLEFISELNRNVSDPRMKMFVSFQTLRLRRQFPELFSSGDYVPITVTGPAADSVCAFSRMTEKTQLIVVAPRWSASLPQGNTEASLLACWQNTCLTDLSTTRELHNIFTGETYLPHQQPLLMSELLANFPIALLVTAF
ncbi:malto-oligosyltrehalose synthase [Planctomicrobium sp. SH664]|uniref:malto-oligosyltrehalose synthase n=1 Tax=Planctomicrobium sp. SH664 TaxID=3448125 RepID=UPI003F5C0541